MSAASRQAGTLLRLAALWTLPWGCVAGETATERRPQASTQQPCPSCGGAPADLDVPAGPGPDQDGAPPSIVSAPDAAVAEERPLPEHVECFEFRAHANGDVASAFPVNPGALDEYWNFSFTPPWTGERHAVSFRALIDDTEVIHHWLLYQNTADTVDGAVAPSSGIHGVDELLAGWAPGAHDLILPDDVAVALGTAFTLEVHYNNRAPLVHPDRSGVEVCVTDIPRQHTAGLHWLGTEAIVVPGAGTASGTCTPRQDMGPITILSSWPHMHLQGSHFRTEIQRGDGSIEVLIDTPFDFNYQASYPTPTQIHHGDRLVTTCTYKGPAVFGPGTSAEMCYNFVLAYPNGALTSENALGIGVTTLTNHCFQ